MSSTRARHREPGSQPGGAVIKASEFTGNAVGVIHTAGAKPHKLAGKDTPLTPVLRTLVLRPGTPWDDDVKVRIALLLAG